MQLLMFKSGISDERSRCKLEAQHMICALEDGDASLRTTNPWREQD